jgi:hypothetical protein
LRAKINEGKLKLLISYISLFLYLLRLSDFKNTGNTTDWLCCSGNGTNYSCVTTGVAVVASTEYVLKSDWTSAATLVCSVNGTSVSKSTHISTNATQLGAYVGLTTLTASRAFAIASYSLETN